MSRSDRVMPKKALQIKLVLSFFEPRAIENLNICLQISETAASPPPSARCTRLARAGPWLPSAEPPGVPRELVSSVSSVGFMSSVKYIFVSSESKVC